MEGKSVYSYAAHWGWRTGIHLTVMSMCFLMSLRCPSLTGILFAMLFLFPITVGNGMVRMRKESPGFGKFSALWLFGIYTVIFGTLICCLVSSMWVVFADPLFMRDYAVSLISDFENGMVGDNVNGMRAAMVIRNAIDAHMLPTGMEFMVFLGWTTCFVGSLLSLVLAFILRKRQKIGSLDLRR